jgi:hypothetical protein
MSAPPLWLDHLPTLRAQAAHPAAPLWWNCAALAQFFGVRRRQALALLHQMDAAWIGSHLVVERSALRRFLADPSHPAAPLDEKARCARVTAVLGELRRQQRARQIAVSLPAAPEQVDFAGLSAGLDWQPQHLSIACETPAELLEKLVALAQALTQDFEAFEAKLQHPEAAA